MAQPLKLCYSLNFLFFLHKCASLQITFADYVFFLKKKIDIDCFGIFNLPFSFSFLTIF